MKQLSWSMVYLVVAIVSVSVAIFSDPTEPNHWNIWIYGNFMFLILESVLLVIFLRGRIKRLNVGLTFFQSFVRTQFMFPLQNESLMKAFILCGLQEPPTVISFFKTLPPDTQRKILDTFSEIELCYDTELLSTLTKRFKENTEHNENTVLYRDPQTLASLIRSECEENARKKESLVSLHIKLTPVYL